MNSLKDLIDVVSEKAGFTKTDTKKFYKAFVESIKEAANSADEVEIKLPEIGLISVKVREAYQAKNPANGEMVEVPRSRRATCRIYPAFNKALNED